MDKSDSWEGWGKPIVPYSVRRRRWITRTKRIVWILACLAMVCGGLVAFSDFEMPQI